MKLKTLRILNFRCCKEVTIELGSMHALVGANNAGKSTILKALDLLFNPSTSKISDESFWDRNTNLTIRIEAVFVDLTASEKSALENNLRPDGTFHFARTVEVKAEGAGDEEGEGKISILPHYNKPVPKYPWLVETNVNAAAIKEWLKTPDQLIANGKSFAEIVGTKPKVEEWKSAATAFAKQHLGPEDFEPLWFLNPKGFPNVLKANLPHFELIPAVRDAADESKVLKTNPFGRLIHEIVRTLDDNLKTEISDKLKATTRTLNREGKEERLAGIIEVENSMKEYLSELMPADLEIEFQSPTIETLLTTPKIFVDDGFRGAIDGKGHGLQRAVIFSILRSYAKLVTTKKQESKRTLILGVEEPELYMHPTAQRTIRRMFRTIADGGDQVLFSTHSALLVDVAYFDEIIRVEAGEKDGNGAKIHQLSINDMIVDIESRWPNTKGKVSTGSIRERYGHAYTPTRNEGFFAKKVILAEGQTESYCLPIYARAMGHDFDALGVAVVDCGGKDQIDRLYRIFNELGIPCYVLFDYDKSNAEAVPASKALLKFLKHSDEPPDQPHISDTFSCFVETWEKDLQSEIPDFHTHTKGASAYLGPCGKSLQARYIATQLTSTSPPHVPPILQTIIKNVLTVCRKGSCLEKVNGDAAQV